MQYTYTHLIVPEQLNQLVALLVQLGSPDWEYSTKDIYYFDTIYFKTELPTIDHHSPKKSDYCTEKIEIVVFSAGQNLSYLPKDINQVFFNSVSLYINGINNLFADLEQQIINKQKN